MDIDLEAGREEDALVAGVLGIRIRPLIGGSVGNEHLGDWLNLHPFDVDPIDINAQCRIQLHTGAIARLGDHRQVEHRLGEPIEVASRNDVMMRVVAEQKVGATRADLSIAIDTGDIPCAGRKLDSELETRVHVLEETRVVSDQAHVPEGVPVIVHDSGTLVGGVSKKTTGCRNLKFNAPVRVPEILESPDHPRGLDQLVTVIRVGRGPQVVPVMTLTGEGILRVDHAARTGGKIPECTGVEDPATTGAGVEIRGQDVEDKGEKRRDRAFREDGEKFFHDGW